ncbi:MAG: dsDNA nuclease domain-containing protein [Spirosomataceae bacterium]
MIKSIYELQPIDISGRYARNGFDYQDHIGANFCLDMLLREDLEEVWFETHDDITLIWRTQSGVNVEFVQVKSNNLSSRWSVAQITYRDKGPGSSLLEKSLNQYRCKEVSTFRIVTSYDVHSDLEILKQKPSARISTEKNVKVLEELINKIKERFVTDIVVPETSKGVDFWVNNCLWDKRPDDIIQLENHNKILSEKVFKGKRTNVVPEHRDELYMLYP